MTPTLSDTFRAAAQSMGMNPTPEEVSEAQAWMTTMIRQAIESGTPMYEAELLAQGFVLGRLWTRTHDA